MISFFSWKKDNNLLVLLLLFTFLVVYYSPNVNITRILFLLLLVPLYNSRRDYLWLAWVFILFDAPGYLFKGGQFADVQRIPIYPIMANISISFFEIALFVLFLKAYLKKKQLKGQKGLNRNAFYFQNEVLIFMFLAGLYVLITVFGFEYNFVNIFRLLMPWAYVFVIFFLMRDEQDFVNFFRLVFPFVFVSFVMLIFYLFEGVHFVNILKADYGIKENLERTIDEGTASAARSLFFVFPSLASLIACFFFLNKEERAFHKGYLLTIIFFIFINTLLTATRGYLLTVMFVILVAGFRYFMSFSNILKVIIVGLLLAGAFSLFSRYNPNIEKQIELSLERNKTVLLLFEGDYTAGGTLGRIDYRIPKIKKEIAKSPIIGHGFSEHYFENIDGDVGFFNVLLNVGYLGAIFLYLVFFSVLVKIIMLSRRQAFVRFNGRSGLVFAYGLIALQIYHFSTNVTYGFAPGGYVGLPERYFIYGLILVHFNVLINKARKNNTLEVNRKALFI